MALDDLALDFNLFHRFATSELTHSGVWAWVLQSLDDRCPQGRLELQGPARALLARIGVPAFTSPVVVTRERPLPGGGGRVDIEAVDGQGRVVVIETKVKARPDEVQRQRYEDAYRAKGHEEVAIAILSTTYDEPWNRTGVTHVGAEDLLRILGAGSYESDVMRQYVRWLEVELESRRRSVAALQVESPESCAAILCSGAAQWGFMRQLGDRMEGPDHFVLYSGTNLGGSPWTQLAFSPGGAPDFDVLFYRLDAWPGRAAEFTLRQYQKPVLPEKLRRLALLRRLFEESVQECGAVEVFTAQSKVPRPDVQEAKVAQVTIPPVSPASITATLPAVHRAFTQRLVDTGWPVRGRPSAAPGARA